MDNHEIQNVVTSQNLGVQVLPCVSYANNSFSVLLIGISSKGARRVKTEGQTRGGLLQTWVVCGWGNTLGNPVQERKKDCRSQGGCRIPQEHGPLSQLRVAHMGSQRLKQPLCRPAWVCARSSVHVIPVNLAFWGDSMSGNGCFSNSFV